ncbi:Spc98 family-domain-containing protein [Limtongia smithiae]|uniref:Spc98 family-domain-containing protein n=1 Tax=Limtongia smithiae TaxID=1125753 RepID=UPI0034CF0ABB
MATTARPGTASLSRWTPSNDGDAGDVGLLATSVSGVTLQTKADELASSRGPTEPSEVKLLSDLPSALQGLNSSTLSFLAPSTIALPNTLPLSTISILHSLAEPALLYKSLSVFIDSPSGLVGQAFRRAIEQELNGYLALVAKMDVEIRKEAQAGSTAPEWKQGWSLGGVTLKKCVYWLREPTLRLRLMGEIVEKCKDKNGGQIINVLYSYTFHGDMFVAEFVNKLLVAVTRPLYEFLEQWIYTGEFRDPYLEFFVRKGDQPEALWEGKYMLDESQVPAFIRDDLIKKILQTGKSLDFIRNGCGDGDWVDKYSVECYRTFQYDGNDREVEDALDTAYHKTVTHLMDILTIKFRLREHIQALKNYLLLGQGDFIAMLMELLATSLDRPANTLYRHNLTSALEQAIRGSNAQYATPEVLRNLDARMLELSHGEIGWDVFTLEYKVEPPLDVIVNAYATRQYLKIFNFLWRLKRVGYALNVAWRRSITGARGILLAVEDVAGEDWKMARACCGEMIHFINQLEYYILYEVIESLWLELQEELDKSDLTLDKLIAVHNKYLADITHKGLLGSGRAGKEDSLIHQLHEILKLMLAFADSMDTLYKFSVEEYTRRQTAAYEDDNDDEDGGGDGGVDVEQHAFARTRIQTLKSSFQAAVERLLTNLAYQSDTEMRFLGVRLNFNEFYVVARRTRESASKQ